ncbi:MAG: NAD(P)/FAD-dependent oxidoreductase [Oleispira sp.]|nr:NAD(P)/FAD-dependent oxidoreductase [Oleispira sp.]MBL4881645.1 NAD(P)/FAD-dependent oxidoreductase [Oleispira sp.]
MESFDHCIVGAGVIGLAIAYKLSQKYTNAKILLIESHPQFGCETSSRNSEVIHAGIYYPESSLKATLCHQGKEQVYDFCQRYNVPHKKIGKLIVATNQEDISTLEKIKNNAAKNSVALTLLDQTDCQKLEPQVTAKAGLYSATTGIIDSHSYMQTLLTLAQQQGVLFSPNTKFLQAEKKNNGFKITLNTQDGQYQLQCRSLINSAGLQAPNIANNIDALDIKHIAKYHYCRGHYFSYQSRAPFSHLIYPVPSKNTVGLGIHATLDMSGQVRFGPDAQYIDSIDYDFNDHNQAARKEQFIAAIKQYYPDLESHKLQPSYSGIRPKLSAAGEAAKDFMIQTDNDHNIAGLINLFGIESPGLTASLSIADYVTNKVGHL